MEFDIIHPPDVVENYAPDATPGTLGEGGEDDDGGEDGSSEDNMEEVTKHNKEDVMWVVLKGRVLHVSTFLSQHPDGELAILIFAGKDATAEFDVIHPPGVVEKYASAPVATDKGDAVANLEEWRDQGMRIVTTRQDQFW